jgi:hypothetical protein
MGSVASLARPGSGVLACQQRSWKLVPPPSVNRPVFGIIAAPLASSGTGVRFALPGDLRWRTE